MPIENAKVQDQQDIDAAKQTALGMAPDGDKAEAVIEIAEECYRLRAAGAIVKTERMTIRDKAGRIVSKAAQLTTGVWVRLRSFFSFSG